VAEVDCTQNKKVCSQ
jgi:hypothetical protein